MPNTITVTATKANTAKAIEYMHPNTGAWQDSNVLLNVTPGVYNNILCRLKGSSPVIQAVWAQPVTVTSGGGGGTPPANAAPALSIVSPAPGASYAPGAPITFIMMATDDVAVASVELFNGAGVSLGVADRNGTQYSRTVNAPTTAGSFPVTAVAKDGGTPALSTTASVTLLVQTAANNVPVANAGQDQSIRLPAASFQLQGVGTDPDAGDTIAGYSWSQSKGPNSATFSSKTEAKPTVSGLVAGDYTFELIVTDNHGAPSLADPVNLAVLPALSASLSVVLSANPSGSAPAGNTIAFTATVTGTAQYVQFKNGSGVVLGTKNAAPYALSVTPQAAGTLTVRAYAVDANGVTVASDPISVTITTAAVTTPALGNTFGRWDATVNQPSGGTWAESGGNGKSLTVKGSPAYQPTGLKGQPALRLDASTGFSLPAIDLSGQNFSYIIVLKADDPTPNYVAAGLIQTSNYTFGENGSFNAYIYDAFYAGTGDQSLNLKLLRSDYYGTDGTELELGTAAPAVISGQIMPARSGAGKTTLRVNATEIVGTWESFQAELFANRGLDLLGTLAGTVQAIHLFVGASQQTYEDWVAYYTSRLSSGVEPYTLFADSSQVAKALLVPENNPSGAYSTGTEWAVDTNAATLDALVVPGAGGVGVFVNNVWLTNLTSTTFQTLNLGSAGTTRRVRFVVGRVEGSNTSEDGINGGYLRRVRYPASSTTGWAQQAKKTKGVVVLGNSISVGAGPQISALNGLWQRVGQARPDMDIYYDGWGNRSWKGSLFTEGARNVSVARWVEALSGYTTKIAYLMLGTNDYTGQGTAAQVSQAFVDFIRVLRAAIPGIIIIVQTPTGRNNEDTDYGGGNMMAYRTQITAAAQGVNVDQVVNGPDVFGSAYTSDGVHPSDEGAQRGAVKIVSVLQPY